MIKDCVREHIGTGVAGVDICAPVHMAAAREHSTHASQANRFLSKQLMFFKASKKSTVRVFPSRSETMAPFIVKKKVGGGGAGMGVQRRQEREGGRDRLSGTAPYRPLNVSLQKNHKLKKFQLKVLIVQK